MKANKKVLFGLMVTAVVLILTGCPSPFTDLSDSGAYKSTATIDTQRMVFIEEDGTETPLLPPEDGGPEDIVDFAVLDDSTGSRNADDGTRVRVIILGRRHGRTAVWVMYRYGGMIVLPNEDGDEGELMELVEAESWGLDGWEYDARALSSDGKVIIGQFVRPDGWEFSEELGDVPDPKIAVWWNLYEKEWEQGGETVSKLVVSRARPMILMEEPTVDESFARCAGSQSRWNREWLERLFRYLVERIASGILDASWNFMADVDGFVDAADVEGGVPDGFYVAEGVDRNGTASWAWFTTSSMEDILEAPDDPSDPPNGDNHAPWPISGPSAKVEYQIGDVISLEVTDDQGNIITDFENFDPDAGDSVSFEAEVVGMAAGGTVPEVTVVDGEMSIEWLDENLFKSADISVTLVDSFGETTAPLIPISVLFVP